MQAIIAVFASFLLAIASLQAPKTVKPKNKKPHDYATQALYIENYMALTGTINGYCGPWAVSVAERYLGNKVGEPSLLEWLATSNELEVDPLSGGISVHSLVQYYEVRGFDISFVDLVPNKCDAQYYAAEKMDEQCVVMVLMLADIGGHVETVIGSEQCVLHTNSWGTEARVSTKGRYTHSNMTEFNDVKTDAFLFVACFKAT